MGFQDNSTINLDAVLTDIGRKKLAQGKFSITHFGLGDDEVDYTLGDINNGTFELSTNPPILEAFAGQNVNILHGLLDVNRDDLLYLPELKLNNKIDFAVRKYKDMVHVTVDRETSKKVKSTIGKRKFLESGATDQNCLIIESGIDPDTTYVVTPDLENQQKYFLNSGLMDKYYFVYCDSRFVDKIYVNQPSAYYRNDEKGNLYTDIQPLVSTVKTSIGGAPEYFETYNCQSVTNQIYQIGSEDGFTLSMFSGPRATVLGLNLQLHSKVVNAAANDPDNRFTVFGQTSQTIFGGSDNYDYIDTNILIEGASSGRQLIIPLRIVRYRTT